MAKLRPKARIIRTIGDQLISGPEAALIELVKNAYDADATWIKIKMAPRCEKFPMGLVRVSDNGHGMTGSDVEEKWLEPATDDKNKNKFSKSGNRAVLGAKGIGRFASSRLGALTKLTTVARIGAGDEYEKTSLSVDWDEFNSSNYLDDLDFPLFREVLTSDSCGAAVGVTLEILNTRVIWTEKNIEKLVVELRRLVSPRDIQGEFNIFLDLSDFVKDDTAERVSTFNGKDLLCKLLSDDLETNGIAEAGEEGFLILPYRIQDMADYWLSGSFNETGEFTGSFSIERGDNKAQKIFIPAPPLSLEENHCGPFSFVVQIYDLESEAVEALFEKMGLDFKRIGVRKARSILNENSGMGVYRDGFRIRPYGDADNDWLRLERRRVQDPSRRLGHTQISGRIRIEGEELSGLVERSSREGFEHNGSFERFRNLISSALVQAEARRFDYRQNAGLSRKAVGDVSHIKETAALRDLASAAEKLPSEYRGILLEKIKKESFQISKSLDELDAYQKLLQSQSVLGLLVARVIHDGRRYLEPMSYAATSLIEGKSILFDQTKKGEVVRKYYPVHAETIATGVKGLSTLFKQLDPVSGKKRGKPSDFKVKEIVDLSVSFMGDFIIESGINIDVDVRSDFFVHGYKGDMQSAVLNILDNAIHWLSTVESDDKRIMISAMKDKNNVILSLKNNGPSIDDVFIDKLFDVGFTLKSEGHGIGLAIAREACRASKGDLYCDPTAADTTFVIVFPSGEAK